MRRTFPAISAARVHPEEDARCIGCSALERHRLAWLFLHHRTNLFDGRPKKMLHLAPEPWFEPRLRSHLGSGYITADLRPSRAMVTMDITRINYPAASFDVIYCSHVLEHVTDDLTAMHECWRILKPGGWALIMVPITAPETFSDPMAITDEDRLRLHGQADHVRRYGPDFVDRLRRAGFVVTVVGPRDLVDDADVVRFGLGGTNNRVFYCTKEAADL